MILLISLMNIIDPADDNHDSKHDLYLKINDSLSNNRTDCYLIWYILSNRKMGWLDLIIHYLIVHYHDPKVITIFKMIYHLRIPYNPLV